MKTDLDSRTAFAISFVVISPLQNVFHESTTTLHDLVCFEIISKLVIYAVQNPVIRGWFNYRSSYACDILKVSCFHFYNFPATFPRTLKP